MGIFSFPFAKSVVDNLFLPSIFNFCYKLEAIRLIPLGAINRRVVGIFSLPGPIGSNRVKENHIVPALYHILN